MGIVRCEHDFIALNYDIVGFDLVGFDDIPFMFYPLAKNGTGIALLPCGHYCIGVPSFTKCCRCYYKHPSNRCDLCKL